MREILFRGKRVDNGEWVEGYYTETLRYNNLHWIWNGKEHVCVDCATVSEFTGLTDKNGKRIFEGDIVHAHYANAMTAEFCEEVVFHNGRFCGLFQEAETTMWSTLPDGVPHLPQDKSVYMDWCAVIGNIHDNPELQEVQG